MPARELLRVAVDALRAHKLRSFLTTLGVVIAVWTIVSVLSVIHGMNEYVLNEVVSLSADVYVITQFGIITSPEQFLQALKRKPITSDEVARLRELCESCAEVGVILTGAKTVHAGSRRIADVPVNGSSPNLASLQNLNIELGRFFTDRDDSHRSPVAVIGAEVRDELFPRLDPVGRTIWVDGLPHQVIGLIARQGTILGQNPDLVVYLPLSAAERMLGRQRSVQSQMAVFVRAAGGVEAVGRSQEEALQVFRWLRHVPILGPNPVDAIGSEQVAQVWKSISSATFFFVAIISSISLVVGAIVVANIMLVSVIERTQEIGLRMALGARPRDLLWQFLLEAALLAMAGGLLGALAGAATAWVVDSQSDFPARVYLPAVALAVVTATVAGMVAGFFPARKAAAMPPIEALRHE